MTSEKIYDVVVIGSGLGGLAAGALLAKAGYSVCLLERNFSLGGAASVYKVGGLTVESSLHQTSDPRNPRDVKHHLLKELGVLDEIEWLPTGPIYRVAGGPLDAPFELPQGFEAAHDALASRFPDKRAAIGSTLRDMEQIYDSLWQLKQAREEGSFAKFTRGLSELQPAAKDWNSTLAEVFEREFAGCEALKCALGANLLYFGDDPDKTWWIYFALAQGANLASGGAYIKGGSRQLSLKIAKVITKNGGVVKLGRNAVGMETDADGNITAVRHVARKSGEDEERVRARVVMANCAPQMASAMLPEAAAAKLDALYGPREVSTSLFCANFGLKQKPDSVGLSAFSTISLPAGMARYAQYAEGARAFGGMPDGALPLYSIANFTAVDSELWNEPPILVSVLGLDRIENWRGIPREAAVERRERWMDAIQTQLDRDYPGFGALVSERALLNAHSMAGYLNTPDGAVYGFAPLAPELPILSGFPRTPQTPLPNLFLASAFGGEHGFNGALLSGAEAARMAARELNR